MEAGDTGVACGKGVVGGKGGDDNAFSLEGFGVIVGGGTEGFGFAAFKADDLGVLGVDLELVSAEFLCAGVDVDVDGDEFGGERRVIAGGGRERRHGTARQPD